MLKKLGLMSLMLFAAAAMQAATVQKAAETKKAVEKKAVETAAPAEEPAAVPAKSKMTFGMKVGVNTVGLESYRIFDLMTNKKPGFTGGLFMAMGGENVQFQPELLFLVGGMDVEDGSMAFNYIEMPLHAKFYLNSASAPNRLHAFVGPSAVFVMTAKMTDEDDIVEDVKENMNTAALSLSGGVGIESGKFTVDIRYSTGLTSITKEDEGPEGQDVGVKSTNLMFGYKFN